MSTSCVIHGVIFIGRGDLMVRGGKRDACIKITKGHTYKADLDDPDKVIVGQHPLALNCLSNVHNRPLSHHLASWVIHRSS